MRAEDLFEAIGLVEEKSLAQCEKSRKLLMGRRKKHSSQHEMSGDSSERKFTGIPKVWLIAAIIGAMVFLMGSGIATLISMKIEEAKTIEPVRESQESELEMTQDQETQGSELSTTEKTGERIEFEKEQDTYVEVGAYYPQEIPAGYQMTFVSDGAPIQNQQIRYEDEADHHIYFWIYIGDPTSVIEVYDISSKKSVNVNGHDGILYEQKNDYRTLMWADERQGYGFVLKTNDITVDLMAMAKSTAEGEMLVPTRAPSTMQAIEQLGDYYPEYLPEGYAEQSVMGSPLEEGGWYSYVRKWFINKRENNQIYFEIETYAIDTESGYIDDAKTVCSFFIPGCDILENRLVGNEVEINGMYGIAAERDVAWADPDNHVVFHLHSEDVTGDELLKVAQSMIRK